MSPNIFVWGLKPRHLGRHFWHPENPPVEGSVRPNSALQGGVGHFRRIFMILKFIVLAVETNKFININVNFIPKCQTALIAVKSWWKMKDTAISASRMWKTGKAIKTSQKSKKKAGGFLMQ